MGGSLGLQFGIGLLAQLVLAAILTAHDFGLFALAVAVSHLFSSIANFGIRTLMSQRSPGEIVALRQPVQRVGMWAALICAVVLAAISPVAADLLGEPELVTLLLVMALTFPLKPYVGIATSLLQARLRFSRVAWALLAATASHYVVAIALARAGHGALSLVIGLQVNAVVAAVTLWFLSRGDKVAATGDAPSARQVVTLARWPLAGEVGSEVMGKFDFLMLGLFVPTEVVGIYYFGYQLVVRLNELLGGVARNVLYPALAQIRHDEGRQNTAVVRAAALMTLGGGAAAALLIASFGSVEEILWGGRWEAAVPTVMLLASAAPGQAMQAAVEQLLKVRGRFRRWTVVIAVRVVGSALVALAVGAMLGGSAEASTVAAAIAVFLVLEVVVELAVVGRGLGVPLRRLGAATLGFWPVLVAAGWAIAALTDGFGGSPWWAAVVAGLLAGSAALAVLIVGRRLGAVERSILPR
ncbi:MAG TPA: oligosaccharide flippase family protein [Acidimicrobiia bacterium]|nr:oligosaccharide flippase family protein [Acidimicrobiia bacterium]